MNSKASLQDAPHWLIASKLMDKSRAEQAVLGARQQNQPLVKYLVSNGLIDSTRLATTAATICRLPVIDLDACDLCPKTLSAVSSALIHKHRVIPLCQQDKVLLLAGSDPASLGDNDEIRFQTDCKPVTVLVEEHKLAPLLQRLLDDHVAGSKANHHLAQQDFDDTLARVKLAPANDEIQSVASESPVTRLVDKILLDALRQGASDIHVEPFEKNARIRFRLDGLLREIARPTPDLAARIVARLKIMARLNIAEKRLPQDGRFKLKVSVNRQMEFRINTLPTLWGEKTVLRLLDQGPEKLALDGLGFNPAQKQLYLDALHRQQGLILVTGPTGSGKSLSLYAGLNLLNTRERNIATVEDPVEIHLDGINQVPVNPRIGLDFAHALRAFLRQDPDILMVGEIRDPETARIAVKAAQTGHLVMSTLHTNSAPETLTRLLDMGIAPYQLANSLTLVVAQRLLRRLCNSCKKPLQLPGKTLIQQGFSPDQVARMQLYGPHGCSLCHDGYRGRTGIFETVAITDAISRVMMDAGNSIQIAELAAKAGFNTLRESALEKAALGLTSLNEVNRVTS